MFAWAPFIDSTMSSPTHLYEIDRDATLSRGDLFHRFASRRIYRHLQVVNGTVKRSGNRSERFFGDLLSALDSRDGTDADSVFPSGHDCKLFLRPTMLFA